MGRTLTARALGLGLRRSTAQQRRRCFRTRALPSAFPRPTDPSHSAVFLGGSCSDLAITRSHVKALVEWAFLVGPRVSLDEALRRTLSAYVQRKEASAPRAAAIRSGRWARLRRALGLVVLVLGLVFVLIKP